MIELTPRAPQKPLLFRVFRVMASAMATTPDVVIHRYGLRGVHDVFQGMCSLDRSVPFVS
jgi:hypothetical protein